MSPEGLGLDGSAIMRLFTEVADELAGDGQHTIVVVGGSLLALHGLRESTRDVDSIRLLGQGLRDAVRRIAARHDLAIDWLNDHATAFAPFDFDIQTCDVLFDSPRLKALGAPLRCLPRPFHCGGTSQRRNGSTGQLTGFPAGRDLR